MAAFHIRPYDPVADNAGLLCVASNLFIPARVRLSVDRSPEFTAFSRVLGDPCSVLVAESGGKIIGFGEFAYQPFSFFGERSIGVHVNLAGVLPQWRRQGVLKALFEEGFRMVRNRQVEWAYALVNVNNPIIRQGTEKLVPGTVPLPRLLIHGLVLPWLPRVRSVRGSYTYETVGDEGLPSLEEFWASRMAGYDVFPLFERSKWNALPGFHANRFEVARDRGGRIVASLGSWDPGPLKRTLIHAYRPWERRFLFHPVNAVLGSLGGRPFPKEGDCLHNLYALRPLADPGQEAALGTLLHRLRAGGKDHNLVLVAFPEGDKRNRLVRKYLRFTNVNIPLLLPLTERFRQRLAKRVPRRFCIEYGFV